MSFFLNMVSCVQRNEIQTDKNVNLNIYIYIATFNDLQRAEHWTSIWEEILSFDEVMWVI